MTLGEYIAQKVREAIDQALQDSENLLKDVARAGGDAASSGLLGGAGILTDVFDLVLGLVDTLAPELRLASEVAKEVAGKSGRFGGMFAIGYVAGYTIWSWVQPIFLPVVHEINHITENLIFDPQTAAGLAARRIIGVDFAKSEGSGGGFDSPHMDKLIESELNFPGGSELLELLRRKVVDKAQAIGALEHDAMPGEWINAYLDLERQLLSSADLALALLRGSISPEFAQEYAARLGVDAEDLQILVDNTGEPPGTMEMLEAYRRGFVDKPRLERAIRQSRTRNEWIDVIERLRFSPMSTADAARAVVENYLPESEGAKIAAENGLDPEHWPFIVKSWGRPLSHEQMMTLYFRGRVNRTHVDQAFRESDLKDKYIDQAFELGRRLLPERLIVDAIKFGALTPTEGAKKLLEHGYSAQDTEILIRLGTAEKKSTVKEFTKAEIVALYEQGLMDKVQAIEHLAKLGYSTHDAELELTLADTKAHAAALRQEATHIRAAFIDGRLDAQQAIGELIGLGMSRQQAQHLETTWTRERGHATRLLTEAQIVKSAADKLITPADALSRLVALGYARTDAVTLLKDKGVTIN